MSQGVVKPGVDYYEVLQISPNADPDTVHRVYRLLAQRFHPDNQNTGDVGRFRLLTDAYVVISNPERRAQYDAQRVTRERDRSKLLADAIRASTAVEAEQLLRLTILELLYARRRTEPRRPGIFVGDIEALIGQPGEHIQFALWYLTQKQYVAHTDGSQLMITADGVDYLEAKATLRQEILRLRGGSPREGH